MAGIKDDFIKTISYIKRDIADAEDEIRETREALGYLHNYPLHLKARYQARINKYNKEIIKQENLLAKYKRELKDFIKDTNFNRVEAEKIMPATDEQLKADYAKDMAELTNPRHSEVIYNNTQHIDIVRYCNSL